jgi:hypothetical protein
MKTKIFILLISLFAISCSNEENPTEAGCVTGILGGDRVFIRCSTRGEFDGETKESHEWGLYKDCKWEKCDNCK